MKVDVRRANAEDWPNLWPLLQGMGHVTKPSETHIRFTRLLQDRAHLLAVAANAQTLVGYAWVQNYGPHLRAGMCTARMHDLFVGPKYRKLGIGRQLLEHLKRWAEDEGITYLEWQANQATSGFYETLGYEAIIDPDPAHPFFEIEFDHPHQNILLAN